MNLTPIQIRLLLALILTSLSILPFVGHMTVLAFSGTFLGLMLFFFLVLDGPIRR